MIEEALSTYLSEGLKDEFGIKNPEIVLQPTRKEFEGNLTFVVFPFLKEAHCKPEELARRLGEYLKTKASAWVADYNVVKGFLNVSIQPQQWLRTLSLINEDPDWGKLPTNGRQVMVEFSSPNTNKPLHLGHLRNNFLGDSVARILEAAGFKVNKVNLVNDRGIHICKSMYAYRQLGKGETPQTAGIKGDHLVGKYYVLFDKQYRKEVSDLVASGVDAEEARKSAAAILQAQELLKKWEADDPETVSLWKQMNGWVYEGFELTYHTMGVTFDQYYYESDTYLLGKDLVNEGLEKEVFYKKSDGSVWVDLSEEGLDHKLVLRADGTSVYMTQDMGTCELKYKNFPFDQSVYVVGNEQDYHFQVLFLIMKKLERTYADGLYHLSYGMVDLPSGKMKSREGTVVDADDLMQQMFDTAEKHTRELGKVEGLTAEEAHTLYRTIGLGALKYYLLRVDPRKRMLFNPEQSIEFQGDTGPFIQYTHARIAAIRRKQEALGIGSIPLKYTGQLAIREAHLIHLLSGFPATLATAAKEYSPALVAQYCFELSKAYNGFYQEYPIFGEPNEQIKMVRLAITRATGETLRIGMNLLGISVPERM